MKNKTLSELAASGNKYAVVAFDETNNWRTSIKAKAGVIEGVYLISLQEPTNCCELAVSYWGDFLRNSFENAPDEDEDKVTEMERDNGGDCGSYFQENCTPKFIKFYADGELDEVLENEQCNPSYC